MKIRATLLGLLALPFAVFAQGPTLTAANSVPDTGFRVTLFRNYNFNPGPAGANVTWDFSNLNHVAGFDFATYGSCALPRTFCNQFPDNPNLVTETPIKVLDRNEANYYRFSSDSYTCLGTTQFRDPFSAILKYTYSIPRDVLRFPMSYNTVFTNAWYAYGSVPSIAEMFTGVDTVKADAWGTIKTPAGIFQALRVRTSATIYDTVRGEPHFAPGGDTGVTHYVRYDWYDGISKIPVYTGVISTTTYTPFSLLQLNSGITINANYGAYLKGVPAGIDILAGSTFNWTVAPNPVTGNLIQVRIESANSAAVSLRLIDLLGREVRTLPAGPVSNNMLTLETTGLPAGTYILQAVANGQPQGVQRVTLIN